MLENLGQHPQAENLPGNSTGFLFGICSTLLSSCPIGILNFGLATTFLSSIRKYSNIHSFELELFNMTNEQFVSTLLIFRVSFKSRKVNENSRHSTILQAPPRRFLSLSLHAKSATLMKPKSGEVRTDTHPAKRGIT